LAADSPVEAAGARPTGSVLQGYAAGGQPSGGAETEPAVSVEPVEEPVEPLFTAESWQPSPQTAIRPDHTSHRRHSGKRSSKSEGSAPKLAAKPRSKVGIALKVIGSLLLAVLAFLAVDAAVLVQRVERVTISASKAVSSDASQSWLIIGADDHPILNEDGSLLLENGEPVGDRADIILVVNAPNDGGKAQIMAVPRDLTVRYDAAGHSERLTLRMKYGADELAAAMCQGLGIPADHVVIVSMDGMIALVDALGGLELNIDYPMRDPILGNLNIERPGLQVVDGANALGLLRAREAERLIDGEWVQMTQEEGTVSRLEWTKVVVDAIFDRLEQALTNPITLQRVAWAASGGVTIDEGTSVLDLADVLLRLDRTMRTLPVNTLPSEEAMWTALPNDETLATLAGYNYFPGRCVRAS
jgi:LCP family protein required for cell wall assembly